MMEKLTAIEERYEELSRLISDPEIIANQDAWRQFMKEHARLEGIVQKTREYRQALADLETAETLLDEKGDADTREWVRAEVEEQQGRIARLEDEIRQLLVPRDPRDQKNVIVEIRAGAGGDEAALFAADLARMYARYAERRGWRTEIMSANETGIGGFKEIILSVEGDGAFSRLKYESGVHRVQRVPETESAGRIHTSTATVAVLPEADEVEVDLNPDELTIDTYRSGGAGGQHVNKTESAIRITHLPTGIVVTCQDERSQYKNKARALKILRAKLLELKEGQQAAELAEERRSQVGTGDRSERIRTYNFPQGRVTDHRIGLTLHRLELVLDGDLDEIIDGLVTSMEAEKLRRAQ